ncbi:hypothetical protein ACVITL_002599 [Rhizobium pisi]
MEAAWGHYCQADGPQAPSFLCLSQESSAPKSLGAKDSFFRTVASFTARTRRGWIPVTSTGMRELGETRNASRQSPPSTAQSTPLTGMATIFSRLRSNL